MSDMVLAGILVLLVLFPLIVPEEEPTFVPDATTPFAECDLTCLLLGEIPPLPTPPPLPPLCPPICI